MDGMLVFMWLEEAMLINFQENFPPTLLFGTTFLLISKKGSLLHSYSGLLLYSEL